MSEDINHPARYNQGGIECWDVEKAFFGVSSHVDHLVQGAIEYELRFGRKNGAQDLRKAAILLTRAADLMESEDARLHPGTCGIDWGKREVPRGETIKDIVREMRKNGVCHDSRHWDELCDRIEAAVRGLREENERLKALLKAVGDYAAQTYELKDALRCIARSARATLKEEDV